MAKAQSIDGPAESTAVLSPLQTSIEAASPAQADEHRGVGGAYELIDGKRVLIERTSQAGDPTPTKGA